LNSEGHLRIERWRRGIYHSSPSDKMGKRGSQSPLLSDVKGHFNITSRFIIGRWRGTGRCYRTHIIGRDYYRTAPRPITERHITYIIGLPLSEPIPATSDIKSGRIPASDNYNIRAKDDDR